jgi:hypothetical protein
LENFILIISDLHCDRSFDDEKPSPRKLTKHLYCWKKPYQALIPLAPGRPFNIPAAIKPENAPDIKLPEYNKADRRPSSFRVYQEDKK